MKFGMRFFCALLSLCLLTTPFGFAAEQAAKKDQPKQPNAAEKMVEVSAKSAIMVEFSTGEVLFEKNPDERLPIASVTKIMTMLLIMEALKAGKITMDEMVTASEYACSMGGSQVFLKPGEQMSVHDMLKAIAVASGNDASVAMGEHIMGSNTAFVSAMNERARKLGMKNTNFMNCNGLDEENHYSSARDVSLMSRELLKHDGIRPFLSIWMDSLRDGAFELANTNKLIRFYKGAIGLKTGSTSQAKYCLSAAATRNDLTLIAVTLAAETSQERFDSATKLLDFGFANYEVARGVTQGDVITSVSVSKGKAEQVEVVAATDFHKLTSKGKGAVLEQQVIVPKFVSAPIAENAKVGDLVFTINSEQVGSVDLVAKTAVPHTSVGGMLWKLLRRWAMVR